MTFFVLVCVCWCFAEVIAVIACAGLGYEPESTPVTRAIGGLVSLIVVCWGLWLLAKN